MEDPVGRRPGSNIWRILLEEMCAVIANSSMVADCDNVRHTRAIFMGTITGPVNFFVLQCRLLGHSCGTPYSDKKN